ncbi:hypothetical protein BLNAU_8005 [Blattamonas nauphoetae]|uniref:Uncharacterized protein n=1 Tax=Blattamonas nauphoetae TaxID=2049346 RepID=A0ABQ9XZL2_9EUKA|nr:hypothetical protein BLNAU_8005 [Blattamonas nauphoetae]
MTLPSPDDLLLPIFEDKPHAYIIKDKNNLTQDQIGLFLKGKGIIGRFTSTETVSSATFTFEVEESPASIEAMNRLLSRGSCIADHADPDSHANPITILPLIAPNCLIFTVDSRELQEFWDERHDPDGRNAFRHKVRILPLPQHDQTTASIVIFSDNRATKEVHDSFTKAMVDVCFPNQAARLYAKPTHFNNQIEMSITFGSLPSRTLFCENKASIVNCLKDAIGKEVLKLVQPHFPGIEAKILLEWRNILNVFKTIHNGSFNERTRVDSMAKKSFFKVRFTPTLLAQAHINAIEARLREGFQIFTSLGFRDNAFKVFFEFIRIVPPELVSDTLDNRTPQRSSMSPPAHSSSPHAHPPTYRTPVDPSTLFPSGRHISVTPPLQPSITLVQTHSSSPSPFHIRHTSPPATCYVPNFGNGILPTPDGFGHPYSLSPPSQPLLSSVESSSASFCPCQTPPDSRLRKDSPPFIPGRSQQSRPSDPPTLRTNFPPAAILQSPVLNHLSPPRSSSPTIHPPQNMSSPLAAPSVVDDSGGPTCCEEDGERNGQYEADAEIENKDELDSYHSCSSGSEANSIHDSDDDGLSDNDFDDSDILIVKETYFIVDIL